MWKTLDMIVSDKKISIALIVIVFLGIIGYFFLWFGYVEIVINHEEIEFFQVNSREKVYKCDENPCRIKVRAGKKFVAQVNHPLSENKTISIAHIPLFATEKVIIQAKEELPMAEMEKISRDSLIQSWPYQIKNSFGPILVSENKKFAIFTRKFAGKLRIFIKNNTSEQFLTEITDDFSEIFLEKNFSLLNSGIVIPAKNRVYYYDFATQRKFKLLEINSLRIADISVTDNSEEVVFYNIKEKAWQKFSQNPLVIKNYSNATKFAGFWGDVVLEIRGNIIYLNGQKSLQIPLKIEASNRFSIRGDNLIVEQDFEVLKIRLK